MSKPIFKIEIDRVELSQSVVDRVISITIDDAAGYENDSCVITLDGREPYPAFPKSGAIATVSLGYEFISGSRSVIPLTMVGRYELADMDWDGAPWELSMNFNSMSVMNAPKSARNEIYEDVTLADIIRKCAARMGYQAQVHSRYNTVNIRYEVQKNMSDAEFVNMLSVRYGAFAKIKNLTLEFRPKDGSNAPTEWVSPSQIEPRTFRYHTQVRAAYSQINSASFSYDTGKLENISVEPAMGVAKGANSLMELGRLYDTAEKARAAAESKGEYLDNTIDALSFTIGGHPRFQSHLKLELVGDDSGEFHPGIPKNWIVTNARHIFTKGKDGAGYKTEVTCEVLKNTEAGQDTDDNDESNALA